MSVGIATLGMFQPCCGGQIVGGGAPPVHQYEQRKQEPPIHVSVLSVKFKKPEDIPEIKIDVGRVTSERKFNE